MKTVLTTVIPVYNGEPFIVQTLESLARQTLRPERVVVIDNCSTDRTEQLVRAFKPIKCEWRRNEANLGLFANCNRALDLAEHTDYLHILHADDLIAPDFYDTLVGALEGTDGFGMAWCLDERIDEEGNRLSVSGRAASTMEEVPLDEYLRMKAEIGNQAFSATLLKPHFQAAPCRFRLDMPILADMAYWPDWGRRCKRIVRVNAALCQYRWHGANTTSAAAPALQALVLDEWLVMNLVEKFRGHTTPALRWMKLMGLFAVRSGIKARRFRERGNPAYAADIKTAVKKITGLGLWLMAQVLVHARDLLIYGLLRRPKHPKNVYS